MKDVVVIIPVYKTLPDPYEIQSFSQCCRILQRYPICMVTHHGVDLSQYEKIATRNKITLLRENFSMTFFSSISGYNRLLLDKRFYKRFVNYKYMLIYQLDAWVFRDELEFWCSKNYDYVGAPWMELAKNGNGLTCTGVGNGGFSLRKITHIINVLSYRGPVRHFGSLNLEDNLKNRLYKFAYSQGYQNTVRYLKQTAMFYEDIFFSVYLDGTPLASCRPDGLTAAFFSFETHPAYLFEQIKQLPFGCHAWHKYEYESFWEKYIPNKI